MPIEALHHKKRKTNIAILLVILGFCALIFGISIVKMQVQNAQKHSETPASVADSTLKNTP